MTVYFRQCGDYLLLSQTIRTNPRQFYAGNTLALQDSARYSPRSLAAGNTLTLYQGLGLRRSVFNLTVSNRLNLSDRARRVFELAVYQNLFLVQSTRTVDYFSVAHNLNLQQTLVATKVKPVSGQLNFQQVAACTVKRNPSLTSTLNFVSAASCYLLRCDFSAIVLPTLNDEDTPIPSDC